MGAEQENRGEVPDCGSPDPEHRPDRRGGRGREEEGGRNQELVLSASLNVPCDSKIILTSIGTDGTDGPTNIAGAIIDGTTIQRAKNLGIDLIEELKKHNSSFVFKKLEDAIYTHDTGTNLMDIIIIYIMGP